MENKKLRRENPNPIDIYVGGRLKYRRTMLGISQEKLAEALNVTFQQIQKYEKGINRIGASRLYQLSEILNISVSFFFEGCTIEPMYILNEAIGSEYGASSANFSKELIKAITKIKNEQVRQKILELIQSLE